MKAREYFANYYDAIIKEVSGGTENKALSRLLIAMLDETIDICEDRHIRLMTGMQNVIREQNNKWNTIANMFERRYGSPVLKKDGFSAWIGKRLSEKLGIKEDEEPKKADEGVEEV